MRICNPKTTVLIFASGKMVVAGAKSETTRASRRASTPASPKVVLLIFVSGKIVFTGAKHLCASYPNYSVDVNADADLHVPPA
ncbi:hypothetical protein B0H14DRAFT_3488010 [Mycena olivaceomarginata]|nr:hypothetical protein B0H14DRAFT_3488010 [Mycena olivaceomarginata]